MAILDIISSLWWLWLFLVLIPLTRSTWIGWRQKKYEHDLKFVLLELRIPREIRKSPKAMEQVLAAIHSLRNSPSDIKESYWDGEVTKWFSLEMVSIEGEIRFFIRTTSSYKDLVEAAFFSYYPDVEIDETEDYLDTHLPSTMQEAYSKGLDLWGADMILAKSAGYPIKTYEDFESIQEEKEYDPIAAFLEVLGKVKKGEVVGIQFLIAAAPSEWSQKYLPLVLELKDRKNLRKKKTGAQMNFKFHGGPLPSVDTKAVEEVEDQVLARALLQRTPGETDVLEAVEENIAYPAFDTLIRYIYLSPKETFYDSFPRKGIAGAFNQYSALNLNYFKRNNKVETRTRIWYWPHIFPKTRNEYRKQRMLYNYRNLENPPETVMARLITSFLFNWNFGAKRFEMNIKGLATLFHPPTQMVLTAPHIRRVDSRKAGPQAGLAIYGEEDEIEKFK